MGIISNAVALPRVTSVFVRLVRVVATSFIGFSQFCAGLISCRMLALGGGGTDRVTCACGP